MHRLVCLYILNHFRRHHWGAAGHRQRSRPGGGVAGALVILLPSIGGLRSRQRPLFLRHWMCRRQCCPSLEQSGPCQYVGITPALCIRSRSAMHSGTMVSSLWRRRRTRLRQYALFCNRTRIFSLERGPRMRMRMR